MNRISENQKIEVENEVKMLDSFIHKEIACRDENSQHKIQRLPRLMVRFKNDISQKEIPLFVEAITEKTVENSDSFHKHIVGGKEYTYPVIQFKRVNKQVVAVCVGEGAESIGGFFSSVNGKVEIAGKEIDIEIDSVKAENIIVQAWKSNFTYVIRKYLPLSSENYAEYQDITDENMRREFLQKILRANILLFADGFGIQPDREIVCILTELEEKAMVKYKNHRFVSFDLKFKTNVSLPNYIGLGIGVAHGFGTVVRMSE